MILKENNKGNFNYKSKCLFCNGEIICNKILMIMWQIHIIYIFRMLQLMLNPTNEEF